jgi:SAM-dependent methyltransferase
MRALIYLLSMGLFGEARALPDFPVDRNVKGFGLSDDGCYAIPLAKKFDYTNTFYDRDPFLDLTAVHPELYGTYDFILSSDVFEHVAPPVERAFEEACLLLKPNGFMCITVPSSAADVPTVEYYPDLYEYAIVQLGGEYVLVNRKKDKAIEIHRNLMFHDGMGATLVMREFSQKDLARQLHAAGFQDVEFQSRKMEAFGISLESAWARPLLVRKQHAASLPAAETPPEFVAIANAQAAPELPRVDVLEAQALQSHKEKANLERRIATFETQMRMLAESRWIKLGNWFGVGPKLR